MLLSDFHRRKFCIQGREFASAALRHRTMSLSDLSRTPSMEEVFDFIERW